MGLHHSTRIASMLIVAVVLMFLSIDSIGLANAQTKAQKDKDKEECAEPLVGLATCLSYVGGDAKAPTPDCCNGLKEVLKNNKKCLCVVVMDRNDPDLGLKINVSLALGLPSVCHTPANVSQCPALLHLPPNSPDAQVFYQFGSGNTSSNQSGSSNHTTTTTPATSPTGGSVASNSSGTSAQQKSNGYSVTKGRRGCLPWEITCCLGVFILCFIHSNTSLKLTSIH